MTKRRMALVKEAFENYLAASEGLRKTIKMEGGWANGLDKQLTAYLDTEIARLGFLSVLKPVLMGRTLSDLDALAGIYKPLMVSCPQSSVERSLALRTHLSCLTGINLLSEEDGDPTLLAQVAQHLIQRRALIKNGLQPSPVQLAVERYLYGSSASPLEVMLDYLRLPFLRLASPECKVLLTILDAVA